MAAGTDTSLAQFLAASRFIRPVDQKKLKFVYDAVVDHAAATDRPVEDLQVLELGCADGPVTLPLAMLGCSVSAIDLDEEAIDSLQRSLAERGLANVTATYADAQEYDDGRKYDVVVAADVISNVPSPPRLLDVIAERAADGAPVALTTPNPYGPYSIQRKYLNPIARLKRWGPVRRLAGKAPAPPREHPRDQFYDRRQLLTSAHLEELFRERGLLVTHRVNSDAVLAGLGPLYARSRTLGRIDTTVAERLPSWAASGWYYRLQRNAR